MAKLLDGQRKSFLFQQTQKQNHLRAIGITHISLLPDDLTQTPHKKGFRNSRHKLMRTESTEKINVAPSQEKLKDVNLNQEVFEDSDNGNAVLVDLEVNKQSLPFIPISQRSLSALPGPTTKLFSTYNYHMKREATFAHPGEHRMHNSNSNMLKAMEDPRFLNLRKSLIASDKNVDGFLQLSPCGQQNLVKYGEPLYDYMSLKRKLTEYGAKSWSIKPTVSRRHSILRPWTPPDVLVVDQEEEEEDKGEEGEDGDDRIRSTAWGKEPW